ncbi:unnamed protein product [Gordionus sp. m RMFG-2023]
MGDVNSRTPNLGSPNNAPNLQSKATALLFFSISLYFTPTMEKVDNITTKFQEKTWQNLDAEYLKDSNDFKFLCKLDKSIRLHQLWHSRHFN